MRVIFLGTPDFAVPSLRALIHSRYEVCAVCTQPDRPAGRGQRVAASPVKQLSLEHGIPVLQPERIRNEAHRSTFDLLRPDFVVVVAYGQILPRWLLDSAAVAPVNVHGSLLPAYRGAAPVNWAILQGETRTGVTTMLMAEKLDAGATLVSREVAVTAEMTAGELHDVLARIGAELLLPTLDGLAAGTIVPVPQDEARASWAPRIRKEMGRIDWSKPAWAIHNQIRGLNPWPLAYTALAGNRLQVLRSSPPDGSAGSDMLPGTFLGCPRDGMRVQCGGRTALEVLEVQPASRHRMTGREYAAGARLGPHSVFVSPDPLPQEAP